MKNYLIIIFAGTLLTLSSMSTTAQGIYVQSVNSSTNNYILNASDLPPLSSYPGSPIQASYGYFWIFEDDGTFSFNEYPDHQFNGNNDHVCMEATPRYTPINKYPNMVCLTPNYPQGIIPTNTTQNSTFPFSSSNNSVQIQTSREPFFDHERTLVISYKNPSIRGISNAQIILYFNSNETSLYQTNDNFNLFSKIKNISGQSIDGIKAYNSEEVPNGSVVSSTSYGSFDRKLIINIPYIQNNSTHNVFLRFKTEILNGNVALEARFIATNELTQLDQSSNLDQPVLSAYDPNRITVNKDYIAYNDIHQYGEKLTYTIHFQNEGNGPTQGVNLMCPLNNDLEMPSLYHITSKYESLLTNPLIWDNHMVKWHFDLSLPGSNQEGFECDQEATKGWVTFSVYTYRDAFYLSNYGPQHLLENTAFIEFVNVSIMETMPALTLISEKELKNHSTAFSIDETTSLNALAIKTAYKSTNSQLKVSIINNNSEYLKVSLVNIMGQMIYNKQYLTTGQTEVETDIPLSMLTEGLYIISVENQTSEATRKIIL